MSKLFRKAGIFLTVLVLLSSISLTAFAYAQIDVDKEVSLTLEYVNNSTPLSGAKFRIYKIADISETNEYALTKDFEKYSVNTENLDSVGWLDLATTLTAYATRDGIEPTANGTTDSAGTLTLDKLKVGLYLVEGDNVTIKNCTYIPTPFIISLPNLNTEDEWEYDATAEVKYAQNVSIPSSEPVASVTSISVVKVWNNDTSETRPDSVTVQLLRNGEVYNEVTLSENNDWKCTWNNLNATDKWQLTEKDVPDGYTVSVSRDGQTFTVTNTCTTIPEGPIDDGDDKEPETGTDTEPPTKDDTQPGGEDNTEDTPPKKPDDSEITGDNVPSGSTTPNDSTTQTDTEPVSTPTEDNSSEEETPKTGDNSTVWIAVSLLSGAGIVTLLIADKVNRLPLAKVRACENANSIS